MRNKLEALKAKLGQFKGAVIAGSVIASTGAFADDAATPLDTALDSVTTSATTGLASIQTHSATVIAAVFGVVLLFVGARHLFSASKAK